MPRVARQSDTEIDAASGARARIGILAAALIVAAAFWIRLSLTHFRPGHHFDEPLLAALAKRAVDSGHFTANWIGAQPGFYWDRATYQFSPHTLLEEAIHWVLYRATGWPRTSEEHIYCARAVSCFWGALGVLVTILATQAAFRSLGAALLAGAILALAPLHLVDSMFARVDTFVCFLVILCFYAVVRGMRDSARKPQRTWPAHWDLVAAAVGGVTIAAKYNAAPVLVLILWLPFARWRSGALGAAASCFQAIALLSIATLGFVIATPEMLLDPRPLVEGLCFELRHYQQGHVPYQAFDWRDNNLFYWTDYLARLGFGYLPLLAVAVFFVKLIKPAPPAGQPLALYLLVAGICALIPRVRFERNLEVIVGPAAIAAAVGFMFVLSRVASACTPPYRWGLIPLLLILFFFQQARTLARLKEAIRPESGAWASAKSAGISGTYYYSDLISEPKSQPEARAYSEVFLTDYNDPFSAANLPAWLAFLGVEHETRVFRSKWTTHGYPFSTLDVVFGPAKLYYVHRGKKDGGQDPLRH